MSFRWNDCYTAYVNLSHRTDRLTHIQNELKRVGIEAERFEALRPMDYKGEPYKVKKMMDRTSGAVGCFISQVEVIKKAKELGKHAFVMEDDLIFCDDFPRRLDYIQDFMDKNEWDIFFMGSLFHPTPWWHKAGHTNELRTCNCTLGKDFEQIGDDHIVRVYGSFSTHCWIINKDSIDKVLKYFDENLHLTIGIDHLTIMMQPYIKAFTFVGGSVIQKDNMSDIGNGMTMYSHFKQLGQHWFVKRMDDFNTSMIK